MCVSQGLGLVGKPTSANEHLAPIVVEDQGVLTGEYPFVKLDVPNGKREVTDGLVQQIHAPFGIRVARRCSVCSTQYVHGSLHGCGEG